MKTPLGPPLCDLDLSDQQVCREILSCDKHQVVEGLVFEHYLDQLSLSEASAQSMLPVDVDTAVVRLPKDHARPGSDFGAFVWARQTDGAGLDHYLSVLSAQMPVWLVQYNETDGEFLAARVADNPPPLPWKPLQELVADITGREPAFEEVASDVRDSNRINQSFWGYLSERHQGKALAFNVILPRIFLNWGIQPCFRYVWNLDRIYVHNGQLWHLEIKHKYPMDGRDGRLAFGMNNGELRVIRTLIACGLRSLHVVIVKPFWDKRAGSMYLLNDLEARPRAAVIGRELTAQNVQLALSSRGGRSGSYTSFTGYGRVPFKSFPASSFHQFGLLGDAHTQIASRMYSQMTGNDQPLCQDSDLRSLRLPYRETRQ